MSSYYDFVLNPISGKFDLVLKEALIRTKESVATKTALPLTGNTENDARFTLDTHECFVWIKEEPTGLLTDWISIGALTIHSPSHQNGGADELDVTDLSGQLADDQKSNWSILANRPSSAVVDIDDAVTKKHVQGTDEFLKNEIVKISDSPIAIPNGNALFFGEWDSRAETPHADDLARTVIGLEVIFNWSGKGQDYACILTKSAGAEHNYTIQIGTWDNVLKFVWFNGDWQNLYCATKIYPNTVYQVIVSHDGSDVRMWINGTEDANSPFVGVASLIPNTHPFAIGNESSLTWTNISNCFISEVKVFNRALTPSEASILWNGGSYNFINDPLGDSSCILRYDFNEGTGITLTDRTGNGHTATINKASWNNNYFSITNINGTVAFNGGIQGYLAINPTYDGWNYSNGKVLQVDGRELMFYTRDYYNTSVIGIGWEIDMLEFYRAQVLFWEYVQFGEYVQFIDSVTFQGLTQFVSNRMELGSGGDFVYDFQIAFPENYDDGFGGYIFDDEWQINYARTDGVLDFFNKHTLNASVLKLKGNGNILIDTDFVILDKADNSVMIKGQTSNVPVELHIKPKGLNDLSQNAILFIGDSTSSFSHPMIIMNEAGTANRIFFRSNDADKFQIAVNPSDWILYNYGVGLNSIDIKSTGNILFNTNQLILDLTNNKIDIISNETNIFSTGEDGVHNTVTIGAGGTNSYAILKIGRGTNPPYGSTKAKIIMDGGEGNSIIFNQHEVTKFTLATNDTMIYLLNYLSYGTTGLAVQNLANGNWLFNTDELVIDNVNKRVGINIASPKATFHSTGSTILGVDDAEIVDGDLGNGQVNLWVDESSGAQKLKLKVKLSGGSVKTGEVDLS